MTGTNSPAEDLSRRDWFRLDNAAKIYPAARRRNWTALFRVSATLTEPVDPEVLQAALRLTVDRIPLFGCTLRKGVFWYYLRRSPGMPDVQMDVGNPCVVMHPRDNRGFCFRVRYHRQTIAVEIYHVLTDGTGGLRFLQTLVAEYLRLRYGAEIPRSEDILDCREEPRPGEMQDAFLHNAGEITRSRAEQTAFHIRGEPDRDNLVNVICGILPLRAVAEKAKGHGVSVTEFLTAVLILAIDALQRRERPGSRRLRPVKINVPVNLRRFFPNASTTLRNFASYVTPGIDPRMGEYTLEEVVRIVHHHMGSEVTAKMLGAKFTTNVRSEQGIFIRLAPLFIKNMVMKMVFKSVGDRKSSTSLSNLGLVRLPPEMARHVARMDFLLGPLSSNRVACAALGYGDSLYVNFTSTIRSAETEREFFTRLVRLGVPVRIESNRR